MNAHVQTNNRPNTSSPSNEYAKTEQKGVNVTGYLDSSHMVDIVHCF